MVQSLFHVALGGAIGASARFLIGVWILRLAGTGFPIAVLSINVFGSFLMGLFVVAAQKNGFNSLSPLVMTGILGGFTTFSAFSLEAVTLMERNLLGQAALYIGLSVGLSIAGLILGLAIARGIWA